MRPVRIGAVLLGVMHVTLGDPAVAAPSVGAMASEATRVGPSALVDGGAGVVLARGGASNFLEMPESRQSAVVPVGEGGEGGRGRRRRGGHYGYAPAPRYYYARPPQRYQPPPRAYYAPRPPVVYAPAPAVSLNLHLR